MAKSILVSRAPKFRAMRYCPRSYSTSTRLFIPTDWESPITSPTMKLFARILTFRKTHTSHCLLASRQKTAPPKCCARSAPGANLAQHFGGAVFCLEAKRQCDVCVFRNVNILANNFIVGDVIGDSQSVGINSLVLVL